MATKTWKIGECCQGGIITAIVTKKFITIQGKEWDESKGWSLSSDQSNAKIFNEIKVSTKDYYNESYEFLTDLSTHYYATEVLDWIESKIK